MEVCEKTRMAGIYLRQGCSFYKRKAIQPALDFYRKAIEMKPDFAEAYYNCGCTYHHVGRLDRATLFYLEAVQIRPDFAMAYFNLGIAYDQQGEYEKAEENLRKAKELFIVADDEQAVQKTDEILSKSVYWPMAGELVSY